MADFDFSDKTARLRRNSIILFGLIITINFFEITITGLKTSWVKLEGITTREALWLFMTIALYSFVAFTIRGLKESTHWRSKGGSEDVIWMSNNAPVHATFGDRLERLCARADEFLAVESSQDKGRHKDHVLGELKECSRIAKEYDSLVSKMKSSARLFFMWETLTPIIMLCFAFYTMWAWR